MQAAGGVAGLLSESSSQLPTPSSFFPTYDGNGNVSEYLTNTGAIAAHFEYDPFGNTVVNTDTANLFTYRFSTKPRDPETGLYYYGYRYYDPMTGRWLNRDPIEEKGGVNLYGFVGNCGIAQWDILGRNPALGAILLGLAVTLADSQMSKCAEPKPKDGQSSTECENCMTRWYVAGLAAIGGGTVGAAASCVGTGPFAPLCALAAVAGGAWAIAEWKNELDDSIKDCSCNEIG